MNRPFTIPADLPQGPDHIWSMLREAGAEGITLPLLADCCAGMPFKRVSAYVNRWREAGAVIAVGPARFAIAPGVKTAPVLRRSDYTGERGEIQQAVWNAMRQMKEGFSLPELALAASTPTTEVKLRTAEEYVRRLIKAGLVLALTPYAKGAKGQKPGAQAGRYRLKPSANTGPRPLKVFATRFVFDPNRGRMVGCSATEEVSA